MPHSSLHWNAVPLPVGSSAIPDSLMLTAQGAAASLLFTASNNRETLLWQTVLADQHPPPAVAVPFDASDGTPSDAAMQQDNTLSVLFTKAGSARCQLFYKNRLDREATFVNHLYEHEIFVRPHFLKHTKGARLPLVALGIIDGETLPVLFPADHDAGYGKYITLPQPTEGTIKEVRLLPYRTGYLLLTKMLIPPAGPIHQRRPPPERALGLHVSVPLGLIFGTLLDSAFHPVGKAFKVLGDTGIFEFDADVQADKVVLLATTATGFLLASGPLDNAGFAPNLRQALPWERPLASPTLIVNANRVHLAILDSPGGKDAKIWTANF